MMWGRNRKIRGVREWMRDGVAWIVATALRLARPAAVVAAVAALGFGTHTAWDRLHQSPQFRLADLTVEGNLDLTVEEIAAACGLVEGRTNVVLTTARSVREACETDARIRQAVVSVEPPARIRVKVMERRAELYAVLPDGLWAISPQGEIFAPVEASALRPLPILTGAADLLRDDPEPVKPPARAPAEEKRAYRAVVEAQRDRAEKRAILLREALSLARITTRDPVPGWRGQSLELSWDPVMGLTVAPLAGGLEARYGHAPFGMKHRRLKQALAFLEKPTVQLTHVFLDNEVRPNEVTVRRRTAPMAAAAGGIGEALP